ncbi:MAG: ATP-binding cassette domain-containing protein, partial [Gammaproteobacteria bacterium]|nr:ATP-binding cassette domain-containing protein [Gammaproteobacteria bacterium]
TIARAQQAIAAMRGISAFMKLEGERQGEVTTGIVVDKGDVEFRDVSFTYPSAVKDALDQVSFKISAGERIGLIGRVGSGKTTIGKLVAGLYPPDKGSILIDGVDIRQYETANLRAGVGFVSQEPELFVGTLRDNIVLGRPNATETELQEAIRIAGVDAFASTHPLGLAMPIGERGRGLSGGQRQAVAIARMLLRQPPVLFLDEPSGAMDNATEVALINRLRDLPDGRHTLIICTHRGSFLDLIDRLLVVEAGRVVLDGPKDVVLKALQAQRGDGIPKPDTRPERAAS